MTYGLLDLFSAFCGGLMVPMSIYYFAEHRPWKGFMYLAIGVVNVVFAFLPSR